MNEALTNWAGNVRFSASQLRRPASVPELQRLVAASPRVRARALGHSFSRIADTPGTLISVAGLPKIIDIDAGRMSVTVSAGLTYGELAPELHSRGYALRNLGSLPHVSVAGACATATHGSGNCLGNLATAVNRMELVTAQGELISLSRDDSGAEFSGAVVALGCLGILTSLGLDIVPTFDLRQYVYDDVPLEQAIADLDELFASAYSVSLFTDWRRPVIRQVWLKTLAGEQDQPDPWPGWLTGTPGRRPASSGARPSARGDHRAAGRPGAVARAAAALQAGIQAERGQRASVRVPAAARAGARGTARDRADQRHGGGRGSDLRDTHRSRRRAVAEPQLPPGHDRAATSPGSMTSGPSWQQSRWSSGSSPRSGRGRTGASCSPSAPTFSTDAMTGLPTFAG